MLNKRVVYTLCAILNVWAPLQLQSNGLDDYMTQEDCTFKYQKIRSWQSQDCDIYLLSMTSQKWKTSQEVEDPLWKHWVKIIVPKRVETQTALLFVRGGSTGDNEPEETSEELLTKAKEARAVVAEVYNVPNQPIKFIDEKDPHFQESGRREDAIIAYTWKKYLQTGDTTWPLRLPMTKAVVKAMDTITSFLESEKQITLEHYVLSGESKRGWATWTTAATDKRVSAIIPVACDYLNTKELFIHQYRSYGAWPPAIKDYVKADIHAFLMHKAFADLLDIEDPFSYRDRLNIPKYLINPTGDKFGVVDGMQFYLSSLQGDNYVRFIPNSDHYLYKYGYLPSLFEFFKAIVYQKKLPRLEWVWEKDKKVKISCSKKPTKLHLWSAENKKARDFREDIVWNSEAIPIQETQTISLKIPSEGWKAYFVEAIFTNDEGKEFPLTSEIFVLPIDLPYELKNKN